MTLQAYYTPDSLEEALALKAAHGHALPVIAGGTILMQQINDGRFFPEMALGLRRAGMDKVSLNGTAVIGATATMTQMAALEELPILQQAARSVGGWAVRNMATVGGNLFNQPPYGDFCTALLALETTVKIQSKTHDRALTLDQFLAGGRVLEGDELISELQVEWPSGQTVYRKFGRRQSNAATIVTVAAQIELEDGRVRQARVALGGVEGTTVRSAAAEETLVGLPFTAVTIAAAAENAAQACTPITDPVASAWYRRRMVEVQLGRALSELLDAEGE